MYYMFKYQRDKNLYEDASNTLSIYVFLKGELK